ncbi:carotenoid biosynthesis protein [Lunatibacter salilacus]|uniref:carotenoid biosynthesis protein n=1 Tax=Lunatibacter salilacus TaxID=2483804 RepID=UPI00131C6F24|nr:carotenoid biosynthesis protein [Lunatibacter salilacus]
MQENQTIQLGTLTINKLTFFKVWVSLFHAVGIVGLALPISKPIFQQLTPFHLLMSTGLLMYFHRGWNLSFIGFSALAFFTGMISEIVGVQTGLIFGDYYYGTVLGTKIWGVPLIIGLNWFLLVYLTGEWLHGKIENHWIAAASGALLMVGIDFVIEPVAISLGFWTWTSEAIPLENYLGWFFIALVLQVAYRHFHFKKQNRLSAFLLLNLILFFAILSVIL